MYKNYQEQTKKRQRTPALWMIIFIYFCFSVYGVKELVEAIMLSFSDKIFMVSSFFFSLVFWGQPLLFALLGIVAFGIFEIKEWARVLSVVLAWAIIMLRIIVWIDLWMRNFFSLPLEDVFMEAVIMAVVSAFFLFVYYYFNIPKIKKMFLRHEKKERAIELFLRNNRRGFALLGLLIAVLIIFILFLTYFKGRRSCPLSGNLSEYGINASGYMAIEDNIRDKVRAVEAERLKKMEQLDQK